MTFKENNAAGRKNVSERSKFDVGENLRIGDDRNTNSQQQTTNVIFNLGLNKWLAGLVIALVSIIIGYNQYSNSLASSESPKKDLKALNAKDESLERDVDKVANQEKTSRGLIDKSKAIGDKTDRKSADKKVVATSPEEASPMIDHSKQAEIFTGTFSGDISILPLGQTSASSIVNILSNYFNAHNLNSIGNVFSSSFLNSHESELQNNASSFLQNYDVYSRVNCICLVKSELKQTENEKFGKTFYSISGKYAIQIIDFKNGSESFTEINVGGAGGSVSRAMASMESNFIEVYKSKNNFNLNNCK